VYTLNPSDVEYVIINGKIVLGKGKILTFNEDEIKEELIKIQGVISHDMQ
jgi:hypothetical protein